MQTHSDNLDISRQPQANTPAPIVLEIAGMGPVPSLKNHKRSIVQSNGKAKPITDPRVKGWMQQAVESFVYQLCYGFQTSDGAMQMDVCPPSSIALLPADDAWTVIPEITLTCELCEPGHEGATITIEPL